jgi:ribosome modulation factor
MYHQDNDGELSMQTKKRDRLGRAHSNGYKAGLTGKTKEKCPYQNTDAKSEWLGGWRDALTDKNLGLFKL